MMHKPSEQFVVLSVKPYIILVDVCVEFIRAQNLGNLDQLIIIVVAVEEGFFPENLYADRLECFP